MGNIVKIFQNPDFAIFKPIKAWVANKSFYERVTFESNGILKTVLIKFVIKKYGKLTQIKYKFLYIPIRYNKDVKSLYKLFSNLNNLKYIRVPITISLNEQYFYIWESQLNITTNGLILKLIILIFNTETKPSK
ncbi:hypothetical protein GGTG_07151 [Gaeumannomyces tritici R3-111a-1]|uniref:Uncharacterized protein n=1 Tax=Gaeumannomyces tritici (strain R3-111a-1) TaxID=644352 RepID=J3P0V5_GAET3|nr:hypothetical protein GGTG_07151 [Gaeumannomyces tritici R3-111a-1]EJT77239.1 hypothetical protein GGTG_07151 [Gaeumannomyces tritici R3-111a-1]